VDSEGLLGLGAGCTEGYLYLPGEGSRQGAIKWRVLVHSERYFLFTSLPEKC